LRRHIVFETRVTGMLRNDASGVWTIKTSTGDDLRARFVVLATGPLWIPKDPDFPGYADFHGEKYQTSRWPQHPVSLEGKRVAIICTGSSGLQAMTENGQAGRAPNRVPAYEEYHAFVNQYP
jgi:cyclohexanone monooxygenase